ncbi:hypothetical protein HJC23_001007 [Cyclotella cryptica]|uniref:Deubiquitinating enzyme MINDY-3/4 conserved domain-containing protein n=1 Tax=Cyclotella cryptica TaxID=29204 RepID=A0ABD3NXY3_9STRA|eukprot:CCRYP_018879-RA/>CCRYP_018879-RA protein AED:0.03 eAED:0.03 QI:141/1/1/1/1/1/3/461/995
MTDAPIDAPIATAEGVINNIRANVTQDNAHYAGSLTEDGFDEEELRAALNMSLHPNDPQIIAPDAVADCGDSAVKSDSSPPTDSLLVKHPPDSTTTNTAEVTQVAGSDCGSGTNGQSQVTIQCQALDDIRPFRKIMWDDRITTTDDKERWIYECITTTFLGGDKKTTPIAGASSKTTTSAAKNPALSPLEVLTGCHTQQSNDCDSKPAAIPDSMHKLWGLTQKHGGPCGVLAAIQAEMIRVLLFGRRRTERVDRKKGERCLVYPFSLHGGEDGTDVSSAASCNPITAPEVEEAIAMAMGMILARASIIPPASSSDKESIKAEKCSVHLVFPESSHDDSQQQPFGNLAEGTAAVTRDWISEMLRSNSNAGDTAPETTSNSLGLNVHTITCPELSETTSQPQSTTTTSNDDEDDDTSPELKRRKKKKEVTFAADNPFSRNTSNNSRSVKISLEEARQQNYMTALAYAVTDYLMGRIPLGSTNGDKIESSPLEAKAIIPLEYFCGPGGVIFFVMSLVHSRGIETIRGDMDDPNTTITSQFGHSSQELINLLLTGQAVSNVFDNSMTLSGELTCRGIQQRPAIGYLSQLESLRYCEVGGYFKSPIFPIWVIGSTSHFSVLFGDEACLRESQSDLLLERCRRAFKKVEGGGESGFISADKLGEVVDELELRGKLGGDHGVHTLQAFLEIAGAGIILWEDAWKSLSRLLTGSTLESIIDSSDGHQGVPANRQEAATSTASSTLQSDEELAKKLAEEWGTSITNDEVDQGANSDEAYARALQAQWDAEVSNASDNANADDMTSQVATTDGQEGSGLFGLDLSDDDSPEPEFRFPGLFSSSGNETPIARPPTPLLKTLDAMPTFSTLVDQNNQQKVQFKTDVDIDTDMKDVVKNTNAPTQQVSQSISLHVSNGQLNISGRPTEKFEFENYGSNFPLYHYNGLRGGTLTPFSVTRLDASEAVGSSIGLSGGASHHGSDDLEAVVRTKWPSCTFNFFGKNAPYID